MYVHTLFQLLTEVLAFAFLPLVSSVPAVVSTPPSFCFRSRCYRRSLRCIRPWVASVSAVAGVPAIDGVPAVVSVSAFVCLPVAILTSIKALFLHDILSS